MNCILRPNPKSTNTSLQKGKSASQLLIFRGHSAYKSLTQLNELGVNYLDYVMERTSGKSYAEFMRSEVFLPLGLTHMSVDIAPGLEKLQAVRYGQDGSLIPFYAWTEDANRTRYTLSLSLKLRGDVLNGAVTALSLPGKRIGNALTHWTELKKQ